MVRVVAWFSPGRVVFCRSCTVVAALSLLSCFHSLARFIAFPFLRSSLSFVARFVFRFPPCPCSHPPPAFIRVVSRGEGRRASRSLQTRSRGLRRLCRFSRVSASFSLRPCFLWLRCSLSFVCLRAAACPSRGLLCVSFVCSCSGSVPLAMPLPALVHLATLSSHAVPLGH